MHWIIYVRNRNVVRLLVQLKNKATVKSNACFSFNQEIKKKPQISIKIYFDSKTVASR